MFSRNCCYLAFLSSYILLNSFDAHNRDFNRGSLQILIKFYCNLQVKNVRIFEASPNGEKEFTPSPKQESFKKALEANHLVFTERRGRFVMVLPVKTEPVYITNIKRGILSALQLQFSEKPQEMIHEVLFML